MEEKFCKECVTARNKFRKGDQVVLSVDGCKQLTGLILKNAHGVVTGFGKFYNVVRIKTDGRKHSESYHAGYWERI